MLSEPCTVNKQLDKLLHATINFHCPLQVIAMFFFFDETASGCIFKEKSSYFCTLTNTLWYLHAYNPPYNWCMMLQ